MKKRKKTHIHTINLLSLCANQTKLHTIEKRKLYTIHTCSYFNHLCTFVAVVKLKDNVNLLSLCLLCHSSFFLVLSISTVFLFSLFSSFTSLRFFYHCNHRNSRNGLQTMEITIQNTINNCINIFKKNCLDKWFRQLPVFAVHTAIPIVQIANYNCIDDIVEPTIDFSWNFFRVFRECFS